jgi:hypothetical protein
MHHQKWCADWVNVTHGFSRWPAYYSSPRPCIVHPKCRKGTSQLTIPTYESPLTILQYLKILVGKQKFYSSEYKRAYIKRNEVCHLSYIVAFSNSSEREQIDCVHNFFHIGTKKEDYLIAAVALVQGVDGASIKQHPVYNVSSLCSYSSQDLQWQAGRPHNEICT